MSDICGTFWEIMDNGEFTADVMCERPKGHSGCHCGKLAEGGTVGLAVWNGYALPEPKAVEAVQAIIDLPPPPDTSLSTWWRAIPQVERNAYLGGLRAALNHGEAVQTILERLEKEGTR